jgi:hypothetical protein
MAQDPEQLVHLVWSPSDEAGRDVAGLVSLLGIDGYGARLLVRAGLPRVLRSLTDPHRARELWMQARELELQVLLVDEGTLQARPRIEEVLEVQMDGGTVLLQGAWGAFRCTEDAVLLLVTSRVEVRRVRTSSRISMMAADSGATPGLPRMVRETTSTEDQRSVLDIFPTGSDRGFRVREESVSYTGTGLPEAPSSLLRFVHLLRTLRTVAPGATLDERFALFDGGEDGTSTGVQVRPGVTVLDGITRFDRYSRLLWLSRRGTGSDDRRG